MRHQLLLSQERVLLALDQLERLLPDLTSDTLDGFVDARWNYARLALAHLDREEDHAFTPLAGDPRPGVAETLARFRAEREHVSLALQAHARRYWTDADIVADLDGYRASLRPLLVRFRAMLLAQRNALYPLLDALDPAAHAPSGVQSTRWTGDIGRYRSAAPAARTNA